MMVLGQGNRAAPPSWIQLSAVMVSVFKQLDFGAMVRDPITAKIVHSVGAMFDDDSTHGGRTFWTQGNCGAKRRLTWNTGAVYSMQPKER